VGWVERITDTYHQVILDYWVVPLDEEEPVAGDDAAEAAWVPVSEISQLRLVDGLAEFLAEHGIIDLVT
jgi:ADP-ribose pyrophosphatase YjhB (NUDIX family)